MIISSWNVNSLRVRLPQVLSWLEANATDILLVQETKVTDDDFPRQEFTDRGLHTLFRGQKTYNGVAMIARKPLLEPDVQLPELLDREKRICITELEGVLIIDVYVPNGSAVGSEKYAYKLQWLETFTQWVSELLPRYPCMLIAGDFNITPDDRDVYDPDAWREAILCSTPEREALQNLLNSGFSDSFRRFNDENGHYTWWDYRAAAFRRNRGLRIDLLLTSTELDRYCTASVIDTAPRGWERPSDHAPISVTLDLSQSS